jgi:predicted nuclease of restriction endonuclease-like (RecB) superfamily
MNSELQHPSSFFTEIRAILQNARQRAYRSVGFVMVEAYWQIGKRIVEEEQHGAERAEYGKRLLRELAQQLTAEFGNGFSTRNLESMRKFFLTYRDRRLLISQTLSAKSNSSTPTRPEDTGDSLPSAEAQTGATHRQHLFPLSWSHYVFLLAIDDDAEREFYEIEAAQQQWSLRELKRQFNASLYERLALSRNKVEIVKLAQQGQIVVQPKDLLRDPYILEFLGLEDRSKYSESDLEAAIIEKLEHFLLELGKGFLFEARQKRFTFGEEHFFVDLVFYNRLLRCYVLLDLKIGKLTHQDLGQMQMYVNYFDRFVKLAEENSTVGIILCKQKHDALVEITLPKEANIFAAQYQLYLPSKEELRQKLLDWVAEQETLEDESQSPTREG